METATQSYDLDTVLPASQTTIARDLKLNLKRLLEEGALTREEVLLALLATASSVQDALLIGFAREQLRQLELTPEQIQEAAESAAIMAMLNTYYRFRHMLGKDDDYRTAGLRMTSLSKPVLGKERFEMLAFAVSVLNGCENCIRSHEQVLRNAGVSADKIHDLARLAATVKGLGTLAG
ncbi:MAG: carboxymuconolactone decarboxylase family protein [Gammaproteobacteria bacterium]|nr:carboxymuconolactone decarboxylase family protein [Gammaproteobacteria bacterium]